MTFDRVFRYVCRVQPDRHPRPPVRWLLLVIAAGCATTAPVDEPAPARDVVAKTSRVADWNQLAKALSSLAGVCGAVGKSRDGEATGIVFPAACLFPGDESTMTAGAQPAVAAIAREMKRVNEREFWINARMPPATRGAGRLNAARAQAVVNALVTAGVPPARLAAVVGLGEPDDAHYDGPATLSATALVEIIVAPSQDEFATSHRFGAR